MAEKIRTKGTPRRPRDDAPAGPKTGKATEHKADRALRTLATEIAVRRSIAARAGLSYAGDRDIYTALGYSKTPSFDDYLARYHRQDIARAVVDAPVRACWREPPRITESKDEETAFETTWKLITKSIRVYHFLPRVDRLASLGTYAVLLLGVDDGKNLAEPLDHARRLIFLAPYSMASAAIESYEADTGSPRFGQPLAYKITMKMPGETGTSDQQRIVHWTRVIHVAEDLLEDNVEGTPRLRAVLNRLHDLDLVVGGSAEMFWRGAFPGLGFSIDHDAAPEGTDLDDLKDEIEDYIHGLKRYMKLEGISIQQLAIQVADPSNHVDVLVTLIAAASRIPKRILLGSERGELASTQDEKAWRAVVQERQAEHCALVILRPLLDRLVEVGILPATKDPQGYSVEWPQPPSTSEKDQAEVGLKKAQALKAYVETPGADTVLPVEMFLRLVLGLSEDQATEAAAMVDDLYKQGGERGQPEDEGEGAA